MPTPRRGESRSDYVQRCIPMVLSEGTASDGSQAAAICNSMYDQYKEKTEVVLAGQYPSFEDDILTKP